MSRKEYMRAYMANRRATHPLQKYQDAKDALKSQILKTISYDLCAEKIESYGQACIELEAARKLYKTR